MSSDSSYVLIIVVMFRFIKDVSPFRHHHRNFSTASEKWQDEYLEHCHHHILFAEKIVFCCCCCCCWMFNNCSIYCWWATCWCSNWVLLGIVLDLLVVFYGVDDIVSFANPFSNLCLSDELLLRFFRIVDPFLSVLLQARRLALQCFPQMTIQMTMSYLAIQALCYTRISGDSVALDGGVGSSLKCAPTCCQTDKFFCAMKCNKSQSVTHLIVDCVREDRITYYYEFTTLPDLGCDDWWIKRHYPNGEFSSYSEPFYKKLKFPVCTHTNRVWVYYTQGNSDWTRFRYSINNFRTKHSHLIPVSCCICLTQNM